MQSLRGEVSGSVGMMAPTAPVADSYAYEEKGYDLAAPPEDRARVGERVIRNGSLTIRVDDTERRLTEARAIAAAEGGFVANASVTERNGVRSAQLTVRVPQDVFDRTMTRLKELASTVFNESTNTEDVTAQFVDLEARLNAARAEEAQYLRILERANTIEETLQVTARLGDVRARIEAMEGQLRYLRDRTEYSTINVTMTEETRVQAPTPTWRPGETLRESLRELVISLQGLADFLITLGVFLLGLVLPVALGIMLVVWIVRALWKKFRSK